MVAVLSLVDAAGAALAPQSKWRHLSESDAVGAYADHLRERGWCVRTSSAISMLFHPPTGATSNLDMLPFEFGKWAVRKGVRVETKEYAAFLDQLKRRIPARLDVIQGNTFRPTPEPFVVNNGATFANTYIPFHPAAPDCRDVPMLEELFIRLFPCETEREWVRCFFGHLIQRPMERPQFGLLITGDGGEGKSLLVRAVSAALGRQHVWQERDFNALSRRFSEVLPDNLVVCLDDAKLPSDAAETLKHMITCNINQVEVKGEQGLVRRDVYARLVVLSNKARPLCLIDDRRWYVPARCKLVGTKVEAQAFGEKFCAFLDQQDAPAKIYWYFKGVDLTSFTVSGCPVTETHALMSEASVSQLDRHIDDFLEDRTLEGILPIFHESTLLDYLRHQGQRSVNPDVVKLKLTDRGYDNSRRRKLGPCRTDVRLWQPTAGSRTRSRSLTADEEAEIKVAAGLEY